MDSVSIRVRLLRFAAPLIGALVALTTAVASSETPDADVFQDWGPVVGNQTVSITTERATYARGERIILWMHLKNVSKEEVQALSWRNANVFHVSVLLPDGKPAPLTLYGKEYFTRRSSGSFGGDLKPGQTRSLDLELSRLFDFTLEGKYTITADRNVMVLKDGKYEPATAVSKQLEITVRESAQLGSEPRVSTASGENQDAAIELSIPHYCKAGQPMPVSITIRNEGVKPFFCDEAAMLPNKGMQMKLENRFSSVAVEMTAGGKESIESPRHGGGGASSETKIESGHQRTWTLDLGGFYNPAGGHYKLAVAFRLRDEQGHDFKVVVDNLFFEVDE